MTQTEIVTMMLGRELEEAKKERSKAVKGDVILELKSYGRRGTIEPFDMILHEGEVIGLAGLLGSGRSETAGVIFGSMPADQGTGQAARQADPAGQSALCHSHGIWPLPRGPQDRRHRG